MDFQNSEEEEDKRILRKMLRKWTRADVDLEKLNIFDITSGKPQQRVLDYYFMEASLSVTNVWRRDDMKYDNLVSTSVSHPVVRLFGLVQSPSDLNNSIPVCINVHGYLPSFYAIPRKYFEVGSMEGSRILSQIELYVNTYVFTHATDPNNRPSNPAIANYFLDNFGNFVEKKTVNVSCMKLQSLRNPVYNMSKENLCKGEPPKYLPIHPVLILKVASPWFVQLAAQATKESGFTVREEVCKFDTFEDKVPFSIKFMSDVGLSANQWVSLVPRTYFLRHENAPGPAKESNCQLEFDVHLQHVALKCVSKINLKNSPTMRVVGLDIETRVRPGSLNHGAAEILQIGMELRNYLPKTNVSVFIGKVILLVGTCDEIVNTVAVRLGCETWRVELGNGKPPGVNPIVQVEMLTLFAECMLYMDPDIIVGHNIINYDLPYIFQRIQSLSESLNDKSITGARCVTRLKDVEFFLSDNLTWDERIIGKLDKVKVEVTGRIILDSYPMFLRKDEDQSSYTLGSLAIRHLPPELQKGDIHFTKINEHQDGGIVSRTELAEYCLQDALIPIMLFEKAVLPSVHESKTVIQLVLEEAMGYRIPSNILAGKGVKYGFAVVYYLQKVKHDSLDVNVDFIPVLECTAPNKPASPARKEEFSFRFPEPVPQLPPVKKQKQQGTDEGLITGPTAHLTAFFEDLQVTKAVSLPSTSINTLLTIGSSLGPNTRIPIVLVTLKSFQPSTDVLSTFGSRGELCDSTGTINVRFHKNVGYFFGKLLNPGTAFILRNCGVFKEGGSIYIRVQDNNIAYICSKIVDDFGSVNPATRLTIAKSCIDDGDELFMATNYELNLSTTAKECKEFQVLVSSL